MMVPVGRLVILRTVPKSELISALAWLTIPALMGPVIGPPLGGFITTYISWRWIFWINIPVGLIGIILATLYVANIREEGLPPLDVKGFILSGIGLAGLAFGFTTIGQGLFPPAVGRRLVRRGRRRLRALCAARARGAGAAARSRPAQGRHLLRQRGRRLPLSHRRRRASLPAAADVAARLRPEPDAIGAADLCMRRRRRRHEDHRRADPPPLRLQARAGDQCRGEQPVPRGDRAVHRRHAALASFSPCSWSAASSSRSNSPASTRSPMPTSTPRR